MMQRPTTIDGLSEIVHDSEHVVVACSWIDLGPPNLSLEGLQGLVNYSPQDQVLTVLGGTSIHDLQEELRQHGQCLPLCPSRSHWLCGGNGCVSELLSMNLPHGLMAQCGSWRDWVLGTRSVMADGTMIKSGCSVVKNVAGYDLHKLFIGSRFTLGIPIEITLRTWPLGAVPAPRIEWGDANDPKWIQRVLPSDIDHLDRTAFHAIDQESGTYWTANKPNRTPHDWLLEVGFPNIDLDAIHLRLTQRAKSLFDPTNKLNSGALGVV